MTNDIMVLILEATNLETNQVSAAQNSKYTLVSQELDTKSGKKIENFCTIIFIIYK